MSKILLVDDDVDLAELVKTKLVAEGHEVIAVNTGEGVFELAKQVKPEIAVLDIMLPGVTGYQICRKFRKDPELYPMAILILTALGEEPEIIHGLEQGADDYLIKPFKLDKLTEKLASLAALLASLGQRNPVTNLPGTDAIKREVNHRLARGSEVAVVYIDMTGFKAYCAAKGAEGQRKALEFVSKMIVGLMRSMGIYETFVAHMGGEHFVVLMQIEDYERFCSTLVSTFDQTVRQLYSDTEANQGFIMAKNKRGGESRYPLMALSVGVSHNQHRQFKSAKKVFEVLAQVRQKAQPENTSVVFVDRRRTDR